MTRSQVQNDRFDLGLDPLLVVSDPTYVGDHVVQWRIDSGLEVDVERGQEQPQHLVRGGEDPQGGRTIQVGLLGVDDDRSK